MQQIGKLVDFKLTLNSISDSISVSQYPSCLYMAFCPRFQKHFLLLLCEIPTQAEKITKKIVGEKNEMKQNAFCSDLLATTMSVTFDCCKS